MSKILILDAIINFLLGVLLLLTIPFRTEIPKLLGVPAIEHAFYPSIMGGVFVGIAIALLIESKKRNSDGMIGLGLGGAIAINLSGGITLLGWLLFGKLTLPFRGQLFLWSLAVILVVISTVELLQYKREN